MAANPQPEAPSGNAPSTKVNGHSANAVHGGPSLAQKLAATWAVSLYFYTPISLMLTLVLIYKSRIALVIMLAYFAYIWTVGRRDVASCSYTSSWVKNWRLWGLYASYFPIRLVKTAELDPAGRYIFAQHPHGVLSLSTWASFCSNACNLPSCFPGIDLHLCETHLCPSCADRAVLLAVGGAQEALLTRSGGMDIILDQRKLQQLLKRRHKVP
eukprot:jgi/Astpho2/8927/Aster-x1550